VGSAVAAAMCLWKGANMVRLHNASYGRDAARLVDSFKVASRLSS
jgi:dihydropteroate synthase